MTKDPICGMTVDEATALHAERDGQSYCSESCRKKFLGMPPPRTTLIAAVSIVAILVHLVLRFALRATPGTYQIPLLATLILGGLPLLYDLLRRLLKRDFGSDLLGGISIITSVLLGEYLAGSIIVLMLSGGEALDLHLARCPYSQSDPRSLKTSCNE
jgi:YHS domain-containing protein